MIKKNIRIQYFAIFRDQAKKNEEVLSVDCVTALDLFDFVKKLYGFKLKSESIRVAINKNFSNMDYKIKDGDDVVFLPPVAGG